MVLDVVHVVLVDIVLGCDVCQDLDLGVSEVGGLDSVGSDEDAQLPWL